MKIQGLKELAEIGFDEIYSSNELSSLESFINAHLEKCGITDETYITNYINAWEGRHTIN